MRQSSDIVLIGRSSSHFTRTARIFALELGVPFTFQPLYDLTTLDAGVYAGNPALKIPILIDAEGPLYGTENICRELTRRVRMTDRVLLRGALPDRLLANAEELVLHVMNTGVTLIMQSMTQSITQPPAQESVAAQPKLQASVDNALAFLDANVDNVLAALPSGRLVSFFEVTLFSLVTHLPFRKLRDVNGYSNLQRFCATFGERPSARATPYLFDVAPRPDHTV